MAKKLGFEENSYGIAFPIVGKNADFSHFVWIGSPDIKTALSKTKKMYSDPLFAEFSSKVWWNEKSSKYSNVCSCNGLLNYIGNKNH